MSQIHWAGVWLFRHTLRYILLQKVKHAIVPEIGFPLSPCQSSKVVIPFNSVKISPGRSSICLICSNFDTCLNLFSSLLCSFKFSIFKSHVTPVERVPSCKTLLVLLAVSVRSFKTPKSLTRGSSLANLSTLIQFLLNITSNGDDEGLIHEGKK